MVQIRAGSTRTTTRARAAMERIANPCAGRFDSYRVVQNSNAVPRSERRNKAGAASWLCLKVVVVGRWLGLYGQCDFAE